MKIFEKTESFTKVEKFTFANTILIALTLFIVIYSIYSKKISNYQLSKDETLQPGESLLSFCKISFQNIIEEKISPLPLEAVVFKTLQNEPDFFSFVDGEEVVDVFPGKDQCRVITKSDEGLRGFLLTLDGGLNNPLFYKITNIDETENLSKPGEK